MASARSGLIWHRGVREVLIVSASPIRTHIRIKDIDTHLSSPGTSYVSQAKTIYLWSVFFKVDGATAQVTSSFNLKGTATVVGTSGDHGDIPGGILASYDQDVKTNLPSTLGDYLTTLIPIPVPGTSFAGAVIGYVVILLYQNDTPDDAATAGHQALNNAIQQGLNSVIPTLGITNPNITPADTQDIQKQVTSAVVSAIENKLSILDKIATVLNTEFQDSFVGTGFQYFNFSQLAGSPPQGIPLSCAIKVIASGFGPTPLYVFNFDGTVVADQLPFSLRRILTGLGHAPPAGLRAVMGSDFTRSAVAWIDKVR